MNAIIIGKRTYASKAEVLEESISETAAIYQARKYYDKLKLDKVAVVEIDNPEEEEKYHVIYCQERTCKHSHGFQWVFNSFQQVLMCEDCKLIMKTLDITNGVNPLDGVLTLTEVTV